MKFLRSNLKVIIAFILGATLLGGIVYAANSAKEVTYTTGKNSEIKNVEQALNDLYNKNAKPFIWKNETHSSMGEQKILCDISKYEHALVLLEYSNSNNYIGMTSMYTFDIVIDKTETISAVNYTSDITATRTLTFKNDGIEISLASYSGKLSGSNESIYAIIDAIILY